MLHDFVGWAPLILNHHAARFGLYRPYGTGKKVFLVSIPIPFPMLRFTSSRLSSLLEIFGNTCITTVC